MLSPGARLGRYEVISPLGAGGMGEVYRARDTQLGREVALKVLHDEVARDPDRLGRFEQEARGVAARNHPHVLTVHDVGGHDGTPYLHDIEAQVRFLIALPILIAAELVLETLNAILDATEERA